MTMAARLTATGRALAEAVDLWRPRPFAVDPPPWAGALPRATAWLAGLDEARVDAIEAADALPEDAPSELRAIEAALAELTTSVVDRAATAPPESLSGDVGWRIPGRKRAQIAAFAAALAPASHAAPGPVRPAQPAYARSPILDWCAGKAHLGRTLGAHAQRPVTALELEAEYQAEAQVLATRLGVALDFVPVDVLGADPRIAAAFAPGTTAVALHACGGLGLRLLRLAAAHDIAEVALAPCCYHRAHPERLPGPLSLAGRALESETGLTLDHSALRLATADEVVAPGRLRRGRRRENAWRLGLDLLVREARGLDVYTPLGILSAELLQLPFAPFAEALAAARGLPLPPQWDPAQAEAAGWERSRRARAFGLVRSLYRRTIELHLVLDRASFLAEAGFATEVVAFCPRAMSPRNLLVIGRRPV